MSGPVFRKMSLVPSSLDPAVATLRRMRRKLDSWADSLGFSLKEDGPAAAIRPEVVRRDPTGRFLFFGDVMDVAGRPKTLQGNLERFVVAAAELGVLLRGGDIMGGKIAFALNSEKAAGKAARILERELVRQGLADEEGSHPIFEVRQLAPNTWVTFW